ncbi:hypothetical protein [Acinetobacter tandoii]|uniref:Uncharacterized protein n=1 Tax=Acinetobacter tandoii DSM 14970 = CIP 107469 TaxID=1120927 RepID=R9B1N1_9GAMM|nr:hypothetical protein [Acinetobacter tandoii]EOR08200.1 hypothetical protein I593_01555 [Acinetobacter tandoii DSM 14970 = CIP 107469]
MWCIKKNGLYLSTKTIVHEDDYWEPSEITAQMTTNIAWVDNVDLADTFIDRMRAESYLAMKRGEFWRNARVIEE